MAGDVSQRFMDSIIKHQGEHEFLNIFIVQPCLNKETNPSLEQASKQTYSAPNLDAYLLCPILVLLFLALWPEITIPCGCMTSHFSI